MSFKKIAVALTFFSAIWLSAGAATQGQEKASSPNPSAGANSASEVEKIHQQARESFLKKELRHLPRPYDEPSEP